MISDVEEQLKEQLKELFPRQFNGMTNIDIMTEIKENNNYYNKHQKGNTFSKSINLSSSNNKTLTIGRNKKKKTGKGTSPTTTTMSPSPSPQPGALQDIDPELGPLPVGKSNGILPHNIINAKMILINPEDYDKQIQKYLPKKNKKDKKNKDKNKDILNKKQTPSISESKVKKDLEWKSYATLEINVELDENECNEWELINKKLKLLEEQTLKKEKKLNRYNDNKFNEINDNDIDKKEDFKIRKFFANIIDKSENVVKTKRIKEIEIQIGMRRKSKEEQIKFKEKQQQKRQNNDDYDNKDEMEASPSPNAQDNDIMDNNQITNKNKNIDHSTLEIEQNEREIGWISLGWIDIQSLVIKASENDKDKEKENKENKENDQQIPEQYKPEFEDDDDNKKDEGNNKENVKILKIPFLLEKQFQELMTQTYLASLELEMMLNEDEEINRDKMEKLIIEQLSNDQLFEFNSRNVDEFEKNFTIVLRTRIRDRIYIKMTGMDLPTIPPKIFNKNENIQIPLQRTKQIKTRQQIELNDGDDDEKKEEKHHIALSEQENELKECNLIVFQSSFTSRKLIHFSLLRPVVLVLKERKLDSNYVNGFVSIIGDESLQFIDPITSSKSTLSLTLPRDVDSCGLIIDFIRFKHPAINGSSAAPRPITPKSPILDDETEDEVLTSKLRNASKKLSIIRIGGSIKNDDGDSTKRILTGRLDIYNLSMDSWITVGELSPPRENMGCTMFYGRVCVTGGNISNNNFEPSGLCEEFSFTERKWKLLKSMNIARFGHCMCQFDEKPTKLFVYGGEIKNGDWTNSVEIYDPQKRGWFIKKESNYNRYGTCCCNWNINNNKYIICCGGQDENDESSKHCEIYNILKNEWIILSDLNYEHGIFPAIWCDSDDNCIYIASQFIIIDQKNKENSIIKYRVEMLDNPNNKWRIIKSNGIFNTQNCLKLLKTSQIWNANAIRKSIGANIKIAN